MFTMSAVSPLIEIPFRIVQEGAFLILKGVRSILQGVRSILQGFLSVLKRLLTILAGLFLNVTLLFITGCMGTITFLLQISPPCKSLASYCL